MWGFPGFFCRFFRKFFRWFLVGWFRKRADPIVNGSNSKVPFRLDSHIPSGWSTTIFSAWNAMQVTVLGRSSAYRLDFLAVNLSYRKERLTVLFRDINHGAVPVVCRVQSGGAFFLVKPLVIVGIVITGIEITKIGVSTRDLIEEFLPEGKIVVVQLSHACCRQIERTIPSSDCTIIEL